MVAGAGCPYGLPSPAETIATRGRTASRNGRVLAVPDPWWATFRRSSWGRPRASSSGSTPCSTSPASRKRCPSTVPSRTIETLLIAVPPSAGCSGTRLASGHRTWNRIVVERELVARGKSSTGWPAAGEHRRPRVVARSGTDHARLVHPPDPVSMQQGREPGDVVLVRMRQHQDVDAAIPRRQALVERGQHPARVRAAIDHHAAPTSALDEDPVALPDVHHDDVGRAIGSVRDDDGEPDRRSGKRERGEPRQAGVANRAPVAPLARERLRSGARLDSRARLRDGRAPLAGERRLHRRCPLPAARRGGDHPTARWRR